MFTKTVTALTATAALGALIAVAAPAPSAEAGGRHWHKPHRVHAAAKVRINHSPYVASWKARKRAIRKWRGKVTDIYGWRFNKWFMAKGKRVYCDARRFRIVCHVSARPRPIGGFGFYRGNDRKHQVIVRSHRGHRRHAY